MDIIGFASITIGIFFIALDGQFEQWPWLLLIYPALIATHIVFKIKHWGMYKDESKEVK